MKKIWNKCRNGIHKVREKWKAITQGPKAFLQEGIPGGIILCVLLGTFFLNGNIIASLFGDVPGIICMMISAIILILCVELNGWLCKLLFGGGKRARIYGLWAFAFVFVSNLVGNQANAIVPAFLMSLLLVLSVNYLGKCIWAFVKTKKFHQIYGYVVSVLSLVYIGLFVGFWNSDHFGENRIEFYLAQAPVENYGEVVGFEQYLKNGTHEVGRMSYGPSNADILTDPLDMTYIVEREGLTNAILDMTSHYKVSETPIAGEIWYPVDELNCPVLFIVHGAHSAKTPSYLGYDYLGEYLASNGYVVVSVDENIVNNLDMTNDIRAVMLLENIKEIFRRNEEPGSPLYGRMDEESLAIAGHSRGGEMVATAYLFNDLNAYPEDGNVKFDYHFQISAVIAIAPTVDQYMPASHAVQIQDVNYLVLHGSNDQDVSRMMGEKQYKNVHFTDQAEDYCKASVYIMGANHGQFNTRWGRYDMIDATNGYLNTYHFIEASEQELIAKAYFRTFLDLSLHKDDTYRGLLMDNRPYLQYLPKTVYMTDYADSTYQAISAFNNQVDPQVGDVEGFYLDCVGMKEWKVQPDTYGMVNQEENYVLHCNWEEGTNPEIRMDLPAVDLSRGDMTFRIADQREESATDNHGLSYRVTLVDQSGNTVSIDSPRYIYPSLALQLYKQDVLFGSYEYKHQMQMVVINRELFEQECNFDFEKICGMEIGFAGDTSGAIILDEINYGTSRGDGR